MKKNIGPFLGLILFFSIFIAATQTLPNGMKVDMKTHMSFIDPNDGTKFFFVKLVEDWTWPQNGMVLKKGTSITVAEPDILQTGVLAQDWKDPKIGWVYKALTEINYYRSGRLSSFTLKEDWKEEKTGMIFKGGTRLALYESGSFANFTLAADWKEPKTGMVLKAGTANEFYDKNIFYVITLAENWQNPKNELVLAADKVIFHSNGNLYEIYACQKLEEPGNRRHSERGHAGQSL
jgi:hypothetical protein